MNIPYEMIKVQFKLKHQTHVLCVKAVTKFKVHFILSIKLQMQEPYNNT